MTKSAITRDELNEVVATYGKNHIAHRMATELLAALDSEPYGFTDGDRRGMIYEPQHADRLNDPLPVYRHAQPALVVSDEVQHVAAVLELIGSFEAADIDSDTVDLRFEIDDVDTGSDVSISEYAARGAAIIRMLAGNAPIKPDGSILEAMENIQTENEVARDQLVILQLALLKQQRKIAELESRTVKLPDERFCPAEYAGSQLWSETEVWNQAISACNG
ncbi:hypothetical protein ABNF90_27640 [Raoultella ornithinolytica]|uniref:hypothetical protein n=2 Tax=Enterobacteriaceae TaxID=543 RepID=UPI00374E8867